MWMEREREKKTREVVIYHQELYEFHSPWMSRLPNPITNSKRKRVKIDQNIEYANKTLIMHIIRLLPILWVSVSIFFQLSWHFVIPSSVSYKQKWFSSSWQRCLVFKQINYLTDLKNMLGLCMQDVNVDCMIHGWWCSQPLIYFIIQKVRYLRNP